MSDNVYMTQFGYEQALRINMASIRERALIFRHSVSLINGTDEARDSIAYEQAAKAREIAAQFVALRAEWKAVYGTWCLSHPDWLDENKEIFGQSALTAVEDGYSDINCWMRLNSQNLRLVAGKEAVAAWHYAQALWDLHDIDKDDVEKVVGITPDIDGAGAFETALNRRLVEMLAKNLFVWYPNDGDECEPWER